MNLPELASSAEKIEKTGRILELKEAYLEKMRETVTSLGIASSFGNTDEVDALMFDLETYRTIIEKYDRQMEYVLTS